MKQPWLAVTCLLAGIAVGCGEQQASPEGVTSSGAPTPADKAGPLATPAETRAVPPDPPTRSEGGVSGHGADSTGTALAAAQKNPPAPAVAEEEPVYQGKPLSAWVGMLRDADPAFRRQGMQAVVAVGGKASAVTPQIIKALADPDAELRCLAARALANVGPLAKDAVPALAKALRDDPAKVRMEAAAALREIGPNAKDAIPLLLDALSDSDESVCGRAAGALIEIGVPKDRPTAARLAASLTVYRRTRPRVGGEQPAFPKEAVTALVGVGEPAVPVLLEMIKTGKGDDKSVLQGDARSALREDAQSALIRVGEPAVPGLIELLTHSDWEVRCDAVDALAAMGPKAKAAVTPLCKAFSVQDPTTKGDELVRRRIAAALGRIKPGADIGPALPPLLKALGEKEGEGRKRLAAADLIALARPGAHGRDAVGPLRKGLAAEYVSPTFTWEGQKLKTAPATYLRALGGIGPDAKPAGEEIARGFEHSEPLVRLAAVEAWVSVGCGNHDKLEPVLLGILRSRADPPLPWPDAARLLSRLGPKPATAGAAVLKEYLTHSDVSVRIAAAEAMLAADLEAKFAAEALTGCMKKGAYSYRVSAAEVLARSSPTHRAEVVETLSSVARTAFSDNKGNPDPWAGSSQYKTAMAALWEIDPKAARRVSRW